MAGLDEKHVPRALYMPYVEHTGATPNNYVKAVAEHREPGGEYGIYVFIHGFDSRVNGAGELARRSLESVVFPWLHERARPNEGRNGYKPSISFSIQKPVNGVNLPVIGYPT